MFISIIFVNVCPKQTCNPIKTTLTLTTQYTVPIQIEISGIIELLLSSNHSTILVLSSPLPILLSPFTPQPISLTFVTKLKSTVPIKVDCVPSSLHQPPPYSKSLPSQQSQFSMNSYKLLLPFLLRLSLLPLFPFSSCNPSFLYHSKDHPTLPDRKLFFHREGTITLPYLRHSERFGIRLEVH